MKILVISLLTVSLSLSLTVVVLAHCGSTWTEQAPTFGPPLGPNGCTANSNPTVTSKSVETTIHWTVGAPKTVVITDSGMNKLVGGFFTNTCVRCFPTFNTPEWSDIGEGKTSWSQKTNEQIVNQNNSCAATSRDPIDHHYEQSCSSEELAQCDFNVCDTGCHWDCEAGECLTSTNQFCYSTPVLLDVHGNGINLTNADGGVLFDLNNDGTREKLSWTSSGSDDSWLVLDRNSNGTIDDGSELFGNYTQQPSPPSGKTRNGFLALAEYDRAGNEGNGDGLVTASDAVFASLRLWQDTNHNGLSEPAELSSLSSAWLTVIELAYKTSQRTDEYGNRFTYRAKVKDTQGNQMGRWAWDVILVKD
jgi:hypothetical protein